jgi:transcriptional regulator with GAF, ATPase, and Fis domain
MTITDSLSEGVRTLYQTAAGLLPARGLGVVRNEDPEHAELTYADAFGATAYRVDATDVPAALRPRPGEFRAVPASELETNSWGVIESRLLHTGFSDDIRHRFGIGQLVTLPIPDPNHPSLLVVGLSDANGLTAAQQSALEGLAADAVKFLNPSDSRERELDLLRRLDAAERLLPAFFRTLDIREIFDQLSAVAKSVVPHDFAGLGVYSDDLQHIDLYVTSAGSSFPPGGRSPHPAVQTARLLYRFVDDVMSDPIEHDMATAKAGGRSSMRVLIRHDGKILGVLNFTSRQLKPYTAADLVVANRIADYVALALSHQRVAERLAEEARRNEELRARTTNIELLDELLAALIDSADLPQVFGRISEIARKVLPHDAAVLMVRLPDGVHARVYAITGFPPLKLPATTQVPPELLANPEWEYDIYDDVSERAPYYTPLAQMGLHSLMRVPIRLDGKFSGALVFFSASKSAFQQTDVLVARRMADRMTVTLAREREIEASKRADEADARASKLESRVKALTEELDARTGYRRVVGDSRQWRQVLTQATQVAATETTVLLLGESGTGKEVVARFLHRASGRAGGPFVALNCAALPEQLLEAELFGYERGAYTGATQSKPGQLEQAAGGTLFLDEVGEMSLSAQAKFLRVLQEREFQRLGGTRVLKTDARIVAATNRDLARAIGQGQFREDLYYRLNVFALQLPPLRERREDILPLSEAFLAEIGRGLGRPPAGISRDARQALVEYAWPGNVRELRNILERAAILCEGGLITGEHLALTVIAPIAAAPAPAANAVAAPLSPGPPSSAGDLQSMERTMIEQALQSARYNKSKAAKALGLTRQQLYVRMRKYRLE